MKGMPKSVRVGGHTYQIKYPYRFKDAAGIQAQCAQHQLEIRIWNLDNEGEELALSPTQYFLLHELLHAIAFIYIKRIDLDEEQVEGLAQGLLQVIKDNPKILTYLQKK